MNKHLQNIFNILQRDEGIAAEIKDLILKSLKDADKELTIAEFKLDRTEKVKRTTSILLEETIEEVEPLKKRTWRYRNLWKNSNPPKPNSSNPKNWLHWVSSPQASPTKSKTP